MFDKNSDAISNFKFWRETTLRYLQETVWPSNLRKKDNKLQNLFCNSQIVIQWMSESLGNVKISL